jgi:hypothetical protein
VQGEHRRCLAESIRQRILPPGDQIPAGRGGYSGVGGKDGRVGERPSWPCEEWITTDLLAQGWHAAGRTLHGGGGAHGHIDQGWIVEDGTHNELRPQGGLYHRLCTRSDTGLEMKGVEATVKTGSVRFIRPIAIHVRIFLGRFAVSTPQGAKNIARNPADSLSVGVLSSGRRSPQSKNPG